MYLNTNTINDNLFLANIEDVKKINIQNNPNLHEYLRQINKPATNKTHEVILLYKLIKYCKQGKYLDAGKLIVRFKERFISENIKFRDKLMDYLPTILRRLALGHHWGVLREIIALPLSVKDDDLHFEYSILIAIIHIIQGDYLKAKELLDYIYNNSKTLKQKAGFMLGMLCDEYLHIKHNYYQMEHLQRNLWSMLCNIVTNTPIILKNVDNIVNYLDKVTDNILDKVTVAIKNNNYKLAIDLLFGIKTSYWLKPSLKLKTMIKFLACHHEKSPLFKIGVLMYKKTGVIIKECFPIVPELMNLIYKRDITLQELIIAMSIISEESKFYQHYFYGLNNGSALGIMQVAYAEAQRICKSLNIPYNKTEVEQNNKLNVLIGIKCFREFLARTKHWIFAVVYYHSGHIGYELIQKFKFMDLLKVINVFAILDMIPGPAARSYIKGVIEFFIIMHVVIFGNPSINIFRYI